MPRVLVIAHLFPPIGGIGVQRALKFTQYLSEYGWSPVVLTTSDFHVATMDPSLLEKVPASVPVYRTADRMARWMARISPVSAHAAKTSENFSAKPTKRSFKQRLLPMLKTLRNTLAIPDEQLLWAISAAFAARHVIRKEQIDCVFTTSGPNSAHLAGYLLKRWLAIPWVADFRDPWTDNMHFPDEGVRAVVERALERRVLKTADALITVTDSFASLFKHKHPSVPAKIHVIRNGVDPADFPIVTPDHHTSHQTLAGERPFTLLYAGILYPKRSPEIFLRALQRAIASGAIQREQIRIEFAGVFDYPAPVSNSQLLKELHLEDVVQPLGYLSHDEVAKRMLQVDGLLLIGDADERAGMYIPGKVYEYLYARKPVFALLQPGEAAKLLEQFQVGVVAPVEDGEKVFQALCVYCNEFIKNWSGGPNEQDLLIFSRQYEAQLLADVLTETLQPWLLERNRSQSAWAVQ